MKFKLVCVQQEEIAHYKIVMESMNINSKAALATFGSILIFIAIIISMVYKPIIFFILLFVAIISLLTVSAYNEFFHMFEKK